LVSARSAVISRSDHAPTPQKQRDTSRMLKNGS
jgi:hypothetical protein